MKNWFKSKLELILDRLVICLLVLLILPIMIPIALTEAIYKYFKEKLGNIEWKI